MSLSELVLHQLPHCPSLRAALVMLCYAVSVENQLNIMPAVL